jgi:hypothetical protein
VKKIQATTRVRDLERDHAVLASICRIATFCARLNLDAWMFRGGTVTINGFLICKIDEKDTKSLHLIFIYGCMDTLLILGLSCHLVLSRNIYHLC